MLHAGTDLAPRLYNYFEYKLQQLKLVLDTREFLNFDELKKIIFLVLHIKITNTLSKIDKINYRHTIKNGLKILTYDQKLMKKINILQTISIKFRSFYDFSFKSDNCIEMLFDFMMFVLFLLQNTAVTTVIVLR